MQIFLFLGRRVWQTILGEFGCGRKRRRRSFLGRWTRPGLETLEGRLAPAAITLSDPTGASLDDFAGSVSVSGNDVVIGAAGTGNFGTAYLFDTAGHLLQTFVDPNHTTGDAFGAAVAISGADVLVSATGVNSKRGEVFLFNTAGQMLQSFTETNAAVNDTFGFSVAISGADVLVGAIGVNAKEGAAFLFSTSGPSLGVFTDPNGASGDEFGFSTAISGSDLVVGAKGVSSSEGAAYLYNTAGQPLQNFSDPNATAFDDFGNSVAISGNNVLVAAAGADNGEGAAYLFNTAGQPLHTFNDPQETSDDFFGDSVAIAGTEVLIGSQSMNGSEGAFLYTTSGQVLANFTAPNVTSQFGSFVGISGDNVVVSDEGFNNFEGVAYVFTTPSEISAILGNNQSATAGTSFGTAIEVSITDALAGPIDGGSVTFTVTDGANGAGASFLNGTTASATTDAAGAALAPQLTANAVAGSFTVTATSGSLSTTMFLTNTSGAPAHVIGVGGTPQNTPAGSAFGTLLQTLVTDGNGNPVADVPVSFAAPSSGPTGTFNALATVPTNELGIATAPALAANHQTGSFVITAAVAGLVAPADFDLTNTLIPTAISVKAGSGQKATVNTAFAAPLEVAIVNAAGQPVSGISVDFETPGSPASGTFAAGAVVTNASGIATAPSLTASDGAGAYTIEAFVVGVTTPAKFNLTNISGAPHTVSVAAGGNQSATVAKAFGSALKTQVVDSFGNAVSGAVVTFTINPQANAGATFPGGKLGATATTNASGITTAPTLTANTTAGSFTVTATVSGVGTAATFDLTNLADPPYRAPQGQPQSAVVGQLYVQPLQARVTDKYGNPIAGLAVTFTAPAQGPSGTFAGKRSAVAITDADGVASAPPFTADTKAGGFALLLTAHGAPAGKIMFTNLPGPAAVVKIVGDTMPTTPVAGVLRNLTVEATDAYGNVIADEPVTFTIQSDPSSGAGGAFAGLAVATTRTNAKGIALAPPLKVNAKRGAFMVLATAFDVAETASFEVTID